MTSENAPILLTSGNDKLREMMRKGGGEVQKSKIHADVL